MSFWAYARMKRNALRQTIFIFLRSTRCDCDLSLSTQGCNYTGYSLTVATVPSHKSVTKTNFREKQNEKKKVKGQNPIFA